MSDPKFYCCAEDLAIGYGKTPLMEHIGLGVGKGSILTLIGPNGAGKSTLLKTLAAQLAPQGGAVLLDGKDLADCSGPERARKMALMVPHTRRTELTTCFEMASAGRYPYTGRLGVLSAEDKRQVHAALALVGAEALAGRDFNRISDGQRQRVLLARAICQQPELILLDEPTSFLDIKGKAELLAILKSLARDKKMAVILSLHELELAQKVSDKVVCVSAAGVSDVMTPEKAFARENICKIYALTDEQYAFLYGEAKAPEEKRPLFEHYVRSGQKLLRCGYTTGTCAALGAAGAARLLLTGRTHQIRVQMAHAGWPLLGDGKYGSQRFNKGFEEKGQALCSYRLRFTFPSDAGELNYLRGREFKVRQVDFAEKYFDIHDLDFD